MKGRTVYRMSKAKERKEDILEMGRTKVNVDILEHEWGYQGIYRG